MGAGGGSWFCWEYCPSANSEQHTPLSHVWSPSRRLILCAVHVPGGGCNTERKAPFLYPPTPTLSRVPGKEWRRRHLNSRRDCCSCSTDEGSDLEDWQGNGCPVWECMAFSPPYLITDSAAQAAKTCGQLSWISFLSLWTEWACTAEWIFCILWL